MTDYSYMYDIDHSEWRVIKKTDNVGYWQAYVTVNDSKTAQNIADALNANERS